MTQRVVKGALYAARNGCLFGLFEPTPKFGIMAFGEFNANAVNHSSHRLGKISTRVHRVKSGDGQGIAVFTDYTKTRRHDFERLIREIFPGCKLEIEKWISGKDERLYWATLTLNRLRQQ